jgi:hypothetical protein
MTLPALLVLFVAWGIPAWGAEREAFPDLDLNDPAALHEASRVLEEELRLATKPRVYLVIDLVLSTIHIKDRGVELHRLPVLGWTASSSEKMAGTFRLVGRPPVVRRKVDPAATLEQDPISLADMPVHYHLAMTPALSLDVVPAADESPFLWAWWHGTHWWGSLKSWAVSFFDRSAFPAEPALQLTMSREQAQSLAWSLLDGMPVVIRRPTEKP